jgi:hypothetical protein
MPTGLLRIEQSNVDTSNSQTVGTRLKMFIDQASLPLEDIGIFVYEVIPFGSVNTSVFIGVASPSDMLNLPAGEPGTPVVGDKFRLEEIDLVFRSNQHLEGVIGLITDDVKLYFKLKAGIEAVPGTPFVVTIT